MFVTAAGGLAFCGLDRYSNNFLVANEVYDIAEIASSYRRVALGENVLLTSLSTDIVAVHVK